MNTFFNRFFFTFPVKLPLKISLISDAIRELTLFEWKYSFFVDNLIVILIVNFVD